MLSAFGTKHLAKRLGEHPRCSARLRVANGGHCVHGQIDLIGRMEVKRGERWHIKIVESINLHAHGHSFSANFLDSGIFNLTFPAATLQAALCHLSLSDWRTLLTMKPLQRCARLCKPSNHRVVEKRLPPSGFFLNLRNTCTRNVTQQINGRFRRRNLATDNRPCHLRKRLFKFSMQTNITATCGDVTWCWLQRFGFTSAFGRAQAITSPHKASKALRSASSWAMGTSVGSSFKRARCCTRRISR